MKRIRSLFSFAFFLLAVAGLAQPQAVLTGRITSPSGQALELVNVSIVGKSGGTSTDKNGIFKLRIPANDSVEIGISFIGYLSETLRVFAGEGKTIEINRMLRESATNLKSVEVRDEKARATTIVRLDPKIVTNIPTINASVEDVIKTLPGVHSSNELSSQYSVRGGNFDENLVYVNDVEIYRPFLIRAGQQEGLSFINPDLVSSILFSSGGFDARFGDKMSSVLDIRYKKPVSFSGSAEASLLGATAHVEGLALKHKLSYLLGVRYKGNQYLLKSLDTKGNYKPSFIDVQGSLNYTVSKKLEISALGYYARNVYKLVPENRETSFGTLDESYRFKIYFDGKEKDKFENYLVALAGNYSPVKDLQLKLTGSVFQTKEMESYDIQGQYWIGKLESSPGNNEPGQVTEILGVGTYLEHSRNFLFASVYSVEHKGSWAKGKSLTQWGARYQHEDISNRMKEWALIDSTGYSLPRPPDDPGNPVIQHEELVMQRLINANNTISTNRLMGYLQDTWTFERPGTHISLTAGARVHYWDYNNQVVVSPRINLALKPQWKNDMVFRLSAGKYSQPPFFREMMNLQGQLNPGIKAQDSYQVLLGSDWFFKAWGRPFKFVSEVYYKYMDNLIPYEVDNVRIRYYGTNNAHGYAAGIDLRVNGEFVPGAESWASLSLMKTMEDIEDDFYFTYQNAQGETIVPGVTVDQDVADSSRIEPGYIPRPTDQRINFSVFFQDYIPGFPTWKMNLSLFYGTGLPTGPTNSPRYKQTRRMPPYRRVDIGLSKQIIGENAHFSPKNPLKHIKSMWIVLEVFNLLQINNTVSYLWISDINSRQYAVPNYLTPRQLNLKLTAEF